MVAERPCVVSRRRRGFGRVVSISAVALLALLLAAGCGKKGQGAKTDAEKAADVETLDTVLAAELTAVDAYGRAIPRLRGEALALARQLRGQGYAHVDAINKAVRGLGGTVDAEAAEPEGPPPADREAALVSLYEAENAALAQALDASAHLELGAPRTLGASLLASHAQHLVVLRQLLGADLAASVPQPFESGEQG